MEHLWIVQELLGHTCKIPKIKFEISQNFFSLIKLYSFKYLITYFKLTLTTIVKAVCFNHYICHTKMGVVCKKDSAKSSQELFTRQLPTSLQFSDYSE